MAFHDGASALTLGQVTSVQVLGNDETDRVVAVEVFRLELRARLLAREVAMPAVEHHALEQHAGLALAVRFDVESQRREFVLRHRTGKPRTAGAAVGKFL
jgi:hypothetical protein